MPHETCGSVPNVVFPTATDLHDDGDLDVYYGAADSMIGTARVTLPDALPAQEEDTTPGVDAPVLIHSQPGE